MILYTSGTLPKKEESEKLLDVKFSICRSFKLKNEHKLYLSTISSIKNRIFRLNYKILEKHKNQIKENL